MLLRRLWGRVGSGLLCPLHGQLLMWPLLAAMGPWAVAGCGATSRHWQSPEPRAQRGRPGSTCTRPAVPCSCQRPLPPPAERTPAPCLALLAPQDRAVRMLLPQNPFPPN